MKLILLISVFYFYFDIVHGKGKCDIGWENHGNKCYQLIYPPGPGKSTEQIHLCKKSFGEGARAVSINSQDESNWLVEYATRTLQAAGKYDAPNRAWFLTGGLKPPGGVLSWSTDDGSSCPLNYTNWGPAEPTGDGTSIVVYLDKSVSPFRSWDSDYYGKWNDMQFDKMEQPIMCEKHANGVKFDPKTCTYVEDDCIKIKKSTLMAILESCACSD